MSGGSVGQGATLHIAAATSLTVAYFGAANLLWRGHVLLPACCVMQGCWCKACVLRTHSEGACWRWLEHMPWSAASREERQRNARVPDAVVMALLNWVGTSVSTFETALFALNGFEQLHTRFVGWTSHSGQHASSSTSMHDQCHPWCPGAVQERFWYMHSLVPGSLWCCRATTASMSAFKHYGQASLCVQVLLYIPEWLCTSTSAAGLLSLAHWASFPNSRLSERTYCLRLIRGSQSSSGYWAVARALSRSGTLHIRRFFRE
jgi:hypothetical protein